MNRHKRSKAGFSLAETLIAILILLMVSAIVAGAIPTASNVYIKTVDAANAQLLLSTTITKLRDELSTAKSVTGFTSSSIEFYNEHGKREISLGPKADSYTAPITGPGVWVYPKKDKTDDGTPYPLVSQQAATSDLYATFSITGVSDGVITIGSIEVKKGDTVLAKQEGVTIRIIGQMTTPPPATGS